VVPNGDPAIIFERAIALLLEALERRRIGKTAHPRPSRGVHRARDSTAICVFAPCQVPPSAG
jgi:hypothetical protein